jgi:hypothetical protein
MRTSRLARITAGAVLLGTPASAIALSAGQADAQSAAGSVSQAPLRVEIKRHWVAYGDDVVVSGSVSRAQRGQRLVLQYAPARGAAWSALAGTRASRTGKFEFTAHLRHSGLLRVTGLNDASTVRTATASDGGAGVAPSSSQRVTVVADFALASQSFDVLSGQSIDIRGRLRPEAANRKVQLLSSSGGSVHWLATAFTGNHGGFDLHYTTGGLGAQRLFVRFLGDRSNGRNAAAAGQLTVYRQSVASWYNDGGSTACGFHATYGVANKSLPCGTQVTFRYGGHTVTATVDDRGPYVGGREWDLNQNTASALGFNGVDTVWSSV